MKRLSRPRGFWGIGIYQPKNETNVGTLFRSAMSYGAAFVFTVGRRYRTQATDTTKTPKHIPLYAYDTIDDLVRGLPWSCPLIGVELAEGATPLPRYVHPERACYLLGAEDYGIPTAVQKRCHQTLIIPSGDFCLNVSVAGSILMYDRLVKEAA
jgi:tRNA G18 (ribose-2'-O)-methylase SpoU